MIIQAFEYLIYTFESSIKNLVFYFSSLICHPTKKEVTAGAQVQDVQGTMMTLKSLVLIQNPVNIGSTRKAIDHPKTIRDLVVILLVVKSPTKVQNMRVAEVEVEVEAVVALLTEIGHRTVDLGLTLDLVIPKKEECLDRILDHQCHLEDVTSEIEITQMQIDASEFLAYLLVQLNNNYTIFFQNMVQLNVWLLLLMQR